MLFEIRDEKGNVYNKVEHPAVVFDKDCGTLLKIGNRDKMLAYFNQTNDKYREKGLHDMADNLYYMELPKDQREIDRVFHNAGYIKRLYDKTFSRTH